MHTTYIIFFFVIILPRILFILFFPEYGGDYEIYTTVAKNILNGCGVSLSDPLSEKCIPHFGGNHGPGYPLFISIGWLIFNNSDTAIRIMQSIIFSISCLWLLKSIYMLTKNKNTMIIIGLIIAFSPLLIAWPRYLQTETLSLAATIYLIAEIIISLSLKRIRVIPIGLALIFATWIRLDNVFLTIPVAVTTIYLHGFKLGIKKGLLIAIILASTWGTWTVRNIIVDLPKLIPTDMIMPDGSRSPTGYLKWTKTWITHEYERPGALWGINRKNYSGIDIPQRAYADNEEKLKIEKLVETLKSIDKQDFPIEIDNKFKEIADQKIKNNPIQYWLTYPSIRLIRMWTNPFSSFGWPNEMPDRGLSKNERLAAAKGNINILLEKAFAYPYHAISKGFNALYRFILMLLLIYSLLNMYKRNIQDPVFAFSLITISYLISRTIFFSLNSNFETRYMVTCIPFIEILVCLTILSIFNKKNKSTNTESL